MIDLLTEITPSINPYQYCYNNPIRYVDLFGLSGEDKTEDESSHDFSKDIWGRNKYDSFSGLYIAPQDRPGGATAKGYGDIGSGHFEDIYTDQTSYNYFWYGDNNDKLYINFYHQKRYAGYMFVWDKPEERFYGNPTNSKWYKYGSPEGEIITLLGVIASQMGIYKEFKNAEKMASALSNILPYSFNIDTGDTFWVNPKYVKYAKWAGYGGYLGDFISVVGATYNGIVHNWTLEHKSDLTASIVGCYPGYGDVASLLYMAGKANAKAMINDKTGQLTESFNTYVNHVGCCFIGDVKVLMSDHSYLNIKSVNVGDSVLTYNFERKVFERNKVLKIDTIFHNDLVKIVFSNGKENINTKDHPYYIKGKGWCSLAPEKTYKYYGIKVGLLEVSDFCFVVKGSKLKRVKVVHIINTNKSDKTYNLTKISNSDNYFVNGVLVNTESINLLNKDK